MVQRNHKSESAISRRDRRDRGREARNLIDIRRESAKCSAQGLAIYSPPICLYIRMGVKVSRRVSQAASYITCHFMSLILIQDVHTVHFYCSPLAKTEQDTIKLFTMYET